MSTFHILQNDTFIKFMNNVVSPVETLIFAAAAFYFIWGVFKYIQNADDPDARAGGGRHILYGTIGIFIMISVWGIIQVIKTTLGA